MSKATPPGDNCCSWPPVPIHVPPPSTPTVLDELRRTLCAAQKEEESDALCAIGGGKESDTARNLQETHRTAKLNASCTRNRPLTGSTVRRNPRSAQFGTWPGNEAAAAPVTAVHLEMGVRVTVPPRTESSIPVPMATNPVTRQLAVNAMSPQLKAMRPIAPDGQVALRFIHFVIFAQRMHPTHQTQDDHVWVATLEENWGVDLWPAMFSQASEHDLSTMTHLRDLIRSNLLRNMDLP
eukprot:5233626-Pleurochrysis_carterae.AAC.1